VASRRERFGTCVQRSRDHREFQMPGVTSGAGFASALTRPSVSFLAAGSGSNTASDGKLLLHMGSVKPQTLYIVLFFQMCCRALKLLIFPCLTGKSPAPRRFLSWFPQGYVRTIGIHAADNCTSQLLVGWMESGDPGERNFTQDAFDSTRRKRTNQCRILVQSCGFVWKARKNELSGMVCAVVWRSPPGPKRPAAEKINKNLSECELRHVLG